jgi:hypothetical protein
MSKVSGKVRAIERRQAIMEETLDKLSKHQDVHSKALLYMRLQTRTTNKYLRSIHQHLMGTKRGRKGIFERLRTLENKQKAIIGVASVIGSACIIGLIKALF